MCKLVALLRKDLALYGRKLLTVLLVTALLLGGTAAMLRALLAGTEREPMRLALVDNDRSALSDAAIHAVADSEDVSSMFTVEYCTEAEATAGMQTGKYAAALLFADNFFSKILDGEKAVTVCLSDRFADAAFAVSHFAKTGETLIKVAEYGVMSAWEPLKDALPYAEANAALTKLELRYAMRLLSLPETAFATEVLPADESGLGLAESYLVCYLVFFFLLTEIMFYPFTVRDLAPPMLRRITSYGVHPLLLIAEKAILPFLVRALLGGGILLFAVRRVPFSLSAAVALLLCSLLCTALTVLLSQSRIGLSLLLALPLAGLLLCGGLLPRAMLPYTVLQLGKYTPFGLLCNAFSPLLGGSASPLSLLGLALWSAVLTVLAWRYTCRLLRKGGVSA